MTDEQMLQAMEEAVKWISTSRVSYVKDTFLIPVRDALLKRQENLVVAKDPTSAE